MTDRSSRWTFVLTSVASAAGAALAGAVLGYAIGRRGAKPKAKKGTQDGTQISEPQVASPSNKECGLTVKTSDDAEACATKRIFSSADANLYEQAEHDEDSAVRLRFVHVNDIYTLQNLPQLRNLISSCGEGMPASNVIVSVGGDVVSPYPLSALDKGRGMVDVLLQCGVRYACFGNHEADISLEALKSRLQEWQNGGGVWLNTNIPDLLPELLLPRHTEVVGFSKNHQFARSVALVGVCTIDRGLYTKPADFGGALSTATNCNDSAYELAKQLWEGSPEDVDTPRNIIDTVVALTHQDTEDDRELARKGRHAGISLILGGHDHGECLEEVDGCIVAKSGSDACKAVVVDLVWRSPDQLRPEMTMDLLPVDAYSRSWPVVRTCERHMAKVHELERLRGAVALVHFHKSMPLMSSQKVRQIQTTIGHLLCNGLRDELQVDCALFDGGNIRGNCQYLVPDSPDPSDGCQSRYSFTLADLETELPWTSEMTSVSMTGAELTTAVAWSRGHLPMEFGGFLQADDGLWTDPDDQTVVTHIDGAPIDVNKIYRVGIIHDTLTGMNGHPTFRSLRGRLGRNVPPLDACRPAKVLLLSHFARRAWTEMPPFDIIDTKNKGYLTHDEIREAYLRVNFEGGLKERTLEQTRGADVFIAQMMSLASNVSHRVSQLEYSQILKGHHHRYKSRCSKVSPKYPTVRHVCK